MILRFDFASNACNDYKVQCNGNMENRFERVQNELVPCEAYTNSCRCHWLSRNSRTQPKCSNTTIAARQSSELTQQPNNRKTFLRCNYKYKRRNRILTAVGGAGEVTQAEGSCVKRTFSGRTHTSSSSYSSYESKTNEKSEYYAEIRIVSGCLKWILCRPVRSSKMLQTLCSFSLILVVAIMTLGLADTIEAGVCWTAREANGKCTQRFSSNLSEQECCKYTNFAYTEREMSDVELFFAAAIDDGAVCKSCLDSCETANCGAGKRCVYRKGRPKCVCAPVCRSSKQKTRVPNTSNLLPTITPNPTSLPQLQAQQHRPIPSFFNFGGMQLDQRDEPGAWSPLSSKPFASINSNAKNSEIRWRRDSESPVAEALTLNRNETEHSGPTKRRKNQRKSKNPSKRRKHSTTRMLSTTTKSLNVSGRNSQGTGAETSNGHQGDSPKSGRMILTAENTERSLNKRRQQQRKAMNSNNDPLSPKHPHHNRHQFKRGHQKTPARTNTTSDAAGKKQETPERALILLEDRIRNGVFSHGAPYPGVDDVLPSGSNGRYYNPVCGTDGKTYKTECQLKKRACRRETTTLAVAYRGHCQTSCKLVRCLNNLTCVEDQYGLPHCVSCTITCPQDDATSVIDPSRAVCGADGLTYKSVCDINRLICTTGRSISVAYYGVCQNEANCNTIQCRDKQICLNDLLTNKPRCISCNFKCPRKRRPQGQRYQEHKICGTNGLTYHSWCQMRRESCNTGFYIDIKHIGACQKNLAPTKPKYT